MSEQGLLIDFFAGGGGASVGIEMFTGRHVDIAVNHDPQAIRMHKTNHPNTLHLTEDIFKVDLAKYVAGRHVALIWASPDCTHFSKAKGGTPLKQEIRMLPMAVAKHAKILKPDVVMTENVEEIRQWGPLTKKGRPIVKKKGKLYQKFMKKMYLAGYHSIETRELVAADYGAPTTRKRWYAIFRRDNKPIVWPSATHSKDGTDGKQKWVPVSSVLDFTDLGRSIFGRTKPLAENTMKRIAKGIDKFIFNTTEPFIVQVNHSGDNFRGQKIHDPLPTITAKHGFGVVSPVLLPINADRKKKQSRCTEKNPIHSSSNSSLVLGFMTKFYKSGIGQTLKEPLHTITTSPGHFGMVSILAVDWKQLQKAGIATDTAKKATWVSQYIMEYYGSSTGQSLHDPLHTIVTKDRFALITVLGNEYVLLDIYLRMLTAEELKLAQGFPADYIIDRDYNWRKYPISEQVRRIGNSVVPIMAAAFVESNCPYLKAGNRVPSPIIYTKENGQVAFA